MDKAGPTYSYRSERERAATMAEMTEHDNWTDALTIFDDSARPEPLTDPVYAYMGGDNGSYIFGPFRINSVDCHSFSHQ